MMKKSLLVPGLLAAVLILDGCGSNDDSGDPRQNRSAAQDTAIPVDPGSAPAKTSSIEPATEPTAEETERMRKKDDRAQLAMFAQKNYKDHYVAAYTDPEGSSIIQFTSVSDDMEKRIRERSRYPDELKIERVKYSARQLMSFKDKLAAKAGELKIEAVGIDTAGNRVNVYASDQTDKAGVYGLLSEDAIAWKEVGELEMGLQ
ncbi:hypothetical protein QWJ34_01005 [Saccharibacillus sp. CPCC 101409]|uniref:hypothetical protein n=1 Tax=Saccharibacillus sp. CPCC 101409 TaxID=3058041 RepID=UPI002672C963|nr:hypothetical protein [Saccharibacillus sp. CPCC 101409]MDO3408338.1 hypothetical protein [Saccharibacillus sp. CPCC 101409]